ncbi:reverse transcriptase domain-containing protein [Tanacetum coccineum]
MDNPNTMEEYIILEEEKAQRHGRTFNWQTSMFGKIKYYEDEDDCFSDFKTEFPATVFDNTLMSDTALPCEPMVSPPNENKIDFRISLDESDDEDYTIMPPRMRTRSAGQHVAKSQGGGKGEWGGRGGRGRGPRGVNDERVDELNGQGNDEGLGANGNVEGVNMDVGNQGNVGNQNGNVVNENVQENIRNVLVNGNRVGSSYKEFLACNPKEYDGKGGAVVLTRWIDKMEFIRTLSQEVAISMSWNDFKFMMIEEFYHSHEMQKLETELWNHAMVEAGHAAYTDRFHELARLVPHLKVKKKGNVGEPSKDKNGRDDNKRTRTGNTFATTANPECEPGKCKEPNTASGDLGCGMLSIRPSQTGSSCLDCIIAQRWRDNCQNQVVANNEGQGRGNQGNQARGRAFILRAKEARQDPNIVTGTFTLNNHFSTTLFDSSTDYSFVSTSFIPLLGIEPSELGFRYEIEIASGQLVEIDKVIKGCKLEIESHVFDINFIPLGHGSFDMIIGMDWLSNHKAEIVCHEKVVRIPLLDGKVLRVLGERPEEKARLLMSAKASDKKQGEIVVVRDFPEVFPDDLSGLPPLQEIKFWIELIPGAVPIAKSPYHLAPSELEELSGQLKEL